MKKENLAKMLIAASLGFNLLPALAFTLDQPPMKSQRNGASIPNQPLKESVNPLYPAKYTPSYIAQIKKQYEMVGKNEIFYVAIDMLKGTNGEFSRNAMLGNNLTGKPVKIEFRNLAEINKNYADYDALGWKRGSRLYIYINQKHTTSPAIALAALLSHESLHQDEFNSLSEETYAWTMEAAVWCELLKLYPDYQISPDSLVQRENTLKKLFERGNYTNVYIKKSVYSNAGYQNLPESSPGFEAL